MYIKYHEIPSYNKKLGMLKISKTGLLTHLPLLTRLHMPQTPLPLLPELTLSHVSSLTGFKKTFFMSLISHTDFDNHYI